MSSRISFFKSKVFIHISGTGKPYFPMVKLCCKPIGKVKVTV